MSTSHAEHLIILITSDSAFDKIKFFHLASEREIHAVCEVILNLLAGTFPIDSKSKSKLSKYKHLLRDLASRGNWKNKKQAILQHGSGFVTHFLLPIVTSLIVELLTDKLKK